MTDYDHKYYVTVGKCINGCHNIYYIILKKHKNRYKKFLNNDDTYSGARLEYRDRFEVSSYCLSLASPNLLLLNYLIIYYLFTFYYLLLNCIIITYIINNLKLR